MYKIEEYDIATYSKAKYKTPTQYLVPQKIVHYKYNSITGEYDKGITYSGRTECGNII